MLDQGRATMWNSSCAPWWCESERLPWNLRAFRTSWHPNESFYATNIWSSSVGSARQSLPVHGCDSGDLADGCRSVWARCGSPCVSPLILRRIGCLCVTQSGISLAALEKVRLQSTRTEPPMEARSHRKANRSEGRSLPAQGLQRLKKSFRLTDMTL